MKDPKALKFFQEVLAKTRAGKILGEPTASEREFYSVLPSGHTILVSSSPAHDSWGNRLDGDIVLALRDDKQDLLGVTPEVDEVSWKELNELHEFARRRALQVDATVDQVISVLGEL
jgi:hypothetical protein